MNTKNGWEDILDADETVLWQGRPDGGISMRPFQIFEAIFGLFFAGFALFWMTMAAKGGGSFWMFGLVHFSAGLGVIFHAIFWSAYVRKHSNYSLTDRRAFIASKLPLVGKRLQSYPISKETPLELVDGALSSLYFASKSRRGKNGNTYTTPVGFERIRDGREVYRLMRDIQSRSSQD
ncbi:MAG: aspartate carbamoyltransferase catalytic subunit [Roseobacter sp. MedPE-SWde]|uniref:hypothetical protein n=1 Tax=Roseobacter sp. MED193 TaxID=314262 RepID=UPI000068A2BD|nr:hypothetical protein [Roseobacter sp. MED193]EAQ44490.1 hypothetical protein MED193_10888 [Roseobacter sp. MED193]OIQ41173.1 MAG: aspartate carbamoyltransferase catalytic subunit [Roseobacter sp. MedPE-SWde]